MRRLGLSLMAAAMMLATPTLAHRGHGGLTVVVIDPATGGVTVTHRFAAHDVEPALVTVAPDAQPTLDDPAAVSALEAHLDRRFRLEVNGERIDLDHEETDLAGDNIRVDFAGTGTAGGAVRTVRVDLDFFPGVHDDQEQQVNIRAAGVTRTVVFRPGSPAQTVVFTR
ncbi:hypothetical protein BZG35_15680 [Brevundimonas sp. LM2]|uniref:DUF6702 family protein n=1 Tax=Brevundimonas sp. LM2 TaxID=1938605 RepID=UPI000983E79F|nr:DUF6702 family protein [Brevundimonas sp. LM2]AQR62934.1 hypothetical protein BZG35_15680 [Brevundimonas sp. LM2]